MKKEKVIVTGGAGFIGSHLVRALVAEGYRVHVIDNLSTGKRQAVARGAKLHVRDITRLDQIERVFKGARCVFHLAALPRVQFSIDYPTLSHEANVTGTLNVLIASEKAGVTKVIYSSSSSVYGDQKALPLTEDMPARPQSPYGLHKHMGELSCRLWSETRGLPTVSLRYFNVYGPGQSAEGPYAQLIPKLLAQRKRGEGLTVTGSGTQTRDFTHVRDVVRANLLAMKSARAGAGEAINIGAGRNVSVNAIARLVGGPTMRLPTRFEPKNTLADNSLARRLLGWKPGVTIEEGIAELKKEAGV